MGRKTRPATARARVDDLEELMRKYPPLGDVAFAIADALISERRKADKRLTESAIADTAEPDVKRGSVHAVLSMPARIPRLEKLRMILLKVFSADLCIELKHVSPAERDRRVAALRAQMGR